MSLLFEEIEIRNLAAQVSHSEDFATHLRQAERTVYCGFDPTAPSLHIGNLVLLLMLRRFQLAGHRPVALVGGATGLIGDPSGRDAERTLNHVDVVQDWVSRLTSQVSQYIDLEGKHGGLVVNNLDWTQGLTTITFLRDVGKHFSVNAMLQRESVKNRIDREGEGISYTEFSYMLLQSLDFLKLYEKFGCTVQIGGSDQWGNMIGGADLIRRQHHQQAFVLTCPLITSTDGQKFGKSAGNAVWLDPALTSPYSFYQFWLNVADADVSGLLKTFTFKSLEEITDLVQHGQRHPSARRGQRALAEELTKVVHGEEHLMSAQRITDALFQSSLRSLEEQDLSQLKLDGMDSSEVNEDTTILAALADSGLAKSRGNARQLIGSNAIWVNDNLIDDGDLRLTRANALFGKFHVVRRGRKTWHLLVHR